jgi:hypothetical protein
LIHPIRVTDTKSSIASISKPIRSRSAVPRPDVDTHLPSPEIYVATCLAMASGAGIRCFTAVSIGVGMEYKAGKPLSRDWTMRDDISNGSTLD